MFLFTSLRPIRAPTSCWTCRKDSDQDRRLVPPRSMYAGMLPSLLSLLLDALSSDDLLLIFLRIKVQQLTSRNCRVRAQRPPPFPPLPFFKRSKLAPISSFRSNHHPHHPTQRTSKPSPFNFNTQKWYVRISRGKEKQEGEMARSWAEIVELTLLPPFSCHLPLFPCLLPSPSSLLLPLPRLL